MGRSILLLAVAAASLGAQEPSRPRLPAAADTNAAADYAKWGASKLRTAPDSAAAAFYWAERIDPISGDGYYSRWVALQLADPERAWKHQRRDKNTLQLPEVLRMDSIELRALELDPLAYRPLDGPLVAIAMAHQAPQVVTERVQITSVDSVLLSRPGMEGIALRPGAAEGASPPLRSKADMALQGWEAYTMGQFPVALASYAKALSSSAAPWAIRAERGRIQYLLNQPDSAASELAAAAVAIERNKHPELAYLYESSAIYEYSRAFALESTQRDSARAGYERVLTIDPSFAAAHVRLGALALLRGDTAGAIGQLDLAAHVDPGDGLIAFLSARALAQAGYVAESEVELKRATALEPYFAAPQLLLALIYDSSGLKAQAAAAYARYVAIARKNDPNLPRARERLAALTPSPTPP